MKTGNRESKEIICIICPIGCRLTVERDAKTPSGFSVSGNQCRRGEAYGIKEMTNPTRVLTTTVKITGALYTRLPVRTNSEIPKDKIFPCMKIINKTEVRAPVALGDVIVKNILGTGVDIVASRSIGLLQTAGISAL